jgi:hypothetical protein
MRPLKQDQCRTNSSSPDPGSVCEQHPLARPASAGAAENLRCHAPLSVGCRPLRTSRPGILLQIHQLAPQQVAAARQPRADSADRNTEDRGGFFIGYAFQTDEEDHLSLLVRQAGDGPFEVAQTGPDGDGAQQGGRPTGHLVSVQVRAAAFAESPRRAGESEAETNERRNSEAIAIGESLPQKFRRQSSTAADRFRIRHRPFGLGHGN